MKKSECKNCKYAKFLDLITENWDYIVDSQEVLCFTVLKNKLKIEELEHKLKKSGLRKES